MITKLPIMELDFNKPEDAKRFLRGFRTPEGERVDWVEIETGEKIILDFATDEQLMSIASQLYDDVYAPSEGGCYFQEDLLQ